MKLLHSSFRVHHESISLRTTSAAEARKRSVMVGLLAFRRLKGEQHVHHVTCRGASNTISHNLPPSCRTAESLPLLQELKKRRFTAAHRGAHSPRSPLTGPAAPPSRSGSKTSSVSPAAPRTIPCRFGGPSRDGQVGWGPRSRRLDHRFRDRAKA